jgi:hypothetical protein
MTSDADLNAEVRSAARYTAQKWADVIETDDAEQEIWLRLLENDYTDRVSDMEKPARATVLRKIGQQIASQYRDDYEVFSGQVTYSTDDVRLLLGAGLIDREREALDTHRETLSGWLDLHEGAQSLRDRNQSFAEIIWRRYVDGAELDATGRKALTRAVDALTREMNRVNTRRYAGHAEGPGTRQVLTNATARVVTARQYAGDSNHVRN